MSTTDPVVGRDDLPGVDRSRSHRGDRRLPARAHRGAQRNAMGPGGAPGPPRPGIWSCASRSCEPAFSSPRCTPPADRPGTVHRGDGGLPPPGLHAEGRRPGRGPLNRHRHKQERSQPNLRRPRPASGRLSASARWPNRPLRPCSSAPPSHPTADQHREDYILHLGGSSRSDPRCWTLALRSGGDSLPSHPGAVGASPI